MTEPDCDPISPDPPRSPGDAGTTRARLDIEGFKKTPEVPTTQGVNPDAASPEPPD
jgi:hypothetical protein